MLEELKKLKKRTNETPLKGEDRKEAEGIKENLVAAGYCPPLLDTYTLSELRLLLMKELQKKPAREEEISLREKILALGYAHEALVRSASLDYLRQIHRDLLQREASHAREVKSDG